MEAYRTQEFHDNDNRATEIDGITVIRIEIHSAIVNRAKRNEFMECKRLYLMMVGDFLVPFPLATPY